MPAVAGSLSTHASDTLRNNFLVPQGDARPHTWLHWMDGNVSAEGMRKDLAALKEVGIAGVQLFNLGNHAPDGPVDFLSPQWLNIFKQSLEAAAEYGIEFSLFNCAGWSSSGGPWITPEHSMQIVTWSETSIDGGKAVDVELPLPPTREDFYREIAVLAVPDRSGRGNLIQKLRPSVEANTGKVRIDRLLDENWDTFEQVRPKKGEAAQLGFRFDSPVAVRSALIASQRRQNNRDVELQWSKDGKQWNHLATLDAPNPHQRSVPIGSANFGPVTASYFRFVSQKDLPLLLSEVRLSGDYVVPDFAKRAGYIRSVSPIPAAESFPDESGHVVDPREVVDLTERVDTSGRLRWQAPEGSWTVIRIGHTSTGASNHPSPPEGQGLECDKLNREAVKVHFDHYAGRMIEQAGELAGSTFKGIALDSFEAASQNWKSGLPESFEQRTGYALRPWLLTLTGRVVESLDSTDRVLWDFRRVLADLYTENYFQYLHELCAEHGMILINEPYGDGNFNSMEGAGRSDVIMTEFWAHQPFKTWQDNRGAMMSAAHIYGKKIAAAEAFTSVPRFAAWKNHPYALKRQADEMFCRGVNRMAFHTYAHQPWPDHILPGMTMGRWGINFNRNTTWWPMAHAWIDYLTRCQHLLQEGLFAADIAFFIGECRPDTLPPIDLPDGYAFDYMNPEVLLNRVEAKEGRIVLPDGMEYKLLMLPEERRMSLPVLRKISELVEAGAVVAGPKPLRTWGYRQHAEMDRNLVALADRLWGAPGTVRVHGKGRVIHTADPKEALEKLELLPSLRMASAQGDSPFMWIQRHIGDHEVYFVSNQREEPVKAELVFRDAGPVAERWDPVSGAITALLATRPSGGGTVLSLDFEPHESCFVVFSSNSRAPTPTPEPRASVTLNGPWSVSFDPRWKAPESIEFAELISWTKHANQFIKFYSGTAVYHKTFRIEEVGGSWSVIDGQETRISPPTQPLWLDLGEVREMARVRLNDKDLGVHWFKPLRVDIAPALRKGENRLEIEVVNLWINRLIGDEQYPDDREWKKDTIGGWAPVKHPDWMQEYFETGRRPSRNRLTYSNWKFYQKEDALLPSGLLGPVRLLYDEP